MSRLCSKVAGEYLRQVSFGLWNVFWQLIIFSTHTASIWDREYAFRDRKYEKKNVFTNSVLFHPKWSKNDLDTIGIGLGSDFYYLFHFLVAKITSLGSEKSYFWGRKNIFASIFLSHPKWCKKNPNTMGISLGSVFVTFLTFSLGK